jgi:L-lactate dehydrogenase
VITAGAKQKPGMTRMDLADNNTAMLKALVPQLIKVASGAVILVVSNPVDVLTYVTLKLSGLPGARVIGSGTVLDSSRFRFLIARRLSVAVQNVHAYIAGEHGDSEVPLWSSATIANILLRDWNDVQRGNLTDVDRSEIFEQVRTAAYQIVAGKGATNYAIGLAAAKILESILHDENRILPVSSLLTNYLPLHSTAGAINDVCLSVPCIVNRKGVERPLPIPIDNAEFASLQASAAAIRSTIKRLGF